MAKHKRAGRRGCGGILAVVLCVGISSSALAWDSPQWVRQLGTASYDIATGVATNREGEVYVAGATAGTPMSGSGSLAEPNLGGLDAWLAKYSASGQLKWKRQLGTAHDDVVDAVATDGNQNVYIAGRISGYLVGGRYSDDAWIARYSQDGAFSWRRQLGGVTAAFASGVATDRGGNVYIAGADFRSRPGADYGSYDAFVAKYSAQGALLWIRHLGASEQDLGKGDISNGVATDRDGNVYISGSTRGSLGATHRGDEDAWLAKYSADGKLRWKRQLGTSGRDASSGVATDREGNVYMSGETRGNLATSKPSVGSADAWLAKYSKKGALLWTRQLGTSDWDYSFAVESDEENNVYISGMTTGSLGAANRGSTDAWIARYSADGMLRWKRQLGTPEGDGSNSVAVDRGGNVYISGYTHGSLGGANQGESGADAFLAKYYTRR